MVRMVLVVSKRGILPVVDIFDEIDEDVRKERLNAVAKKYGPFFGGVVALIIGSVAAVTFWEQHKEAKSADAGTSFLSAVRDETVNPGSGASSFAQVAEEGPAGYGVLARIKQAESLAASGDRAGAIQVLDLAKSVDAPERYTALASILSLSLRSYDEKPEELLPLVDTLTVSDHPWRLFAIELAAALELKLGRFNDARKRLNIISSDASAPVSMRARAEMMLSGLPES